MPKHSADLQTPETRWLNSQDFEFICFNLARELMTFEEPIPDYSTRNNNMLESSLGAPKQTFDGKLLYPTLIKQASIFFYSLIKNHPFENGNKRIAVMALLTFLAFNNKWLSIKPYNLYLIAYVVSKSKPEKREYFLRKIERTIKKFIQNFPKKL